MTPARRSHRRESAEAVGFALKDIISNVVSGMLILGLRPFEIGDEIAIGDIEGTVQRIRLRATDVRLELRFWTDSRRADMVSTTSDVRRRIVETFRRAGIPLPDPGLQRVLLTSRTPPGTPASSRVDA